MQQCWPPAPEEEVDSLDDFAYVYRCDSCEAEVIMPSTVSPVVAQEIAISENPDWIFLQNETFCSKECKANFDISAQGV